MKTDIEIAQSAEMLPISQIGADNLREALEMLCETPVDIIYIVDSYGSLYPENIEKYSKMYLEYANKSNKQIGIHAHNNQNLAFANTIEALSYGVSYLDSTVQGMGRGAGNCASELLLGFLRNPKYSLYPLLTFIENYMVPLKESGVVWGYDLQYLFTGQLNRHPRSAIKFTNEKRKDYCDFYKDLLDDSVF